MQMEVDYESLYLFLSLAGGRTQAVNHQVAHVHREGDQSESCHRSQGQVRTTDEGLNPFAGSVKDCIYSRGQGFEARDECS